MKISELISLLQQYPSDMEVVMYRKQGMCTPKIKLEEQYSYLSADGVNYGITDYPFQDDPKVLVISLENKE